jgi:1,4-alpha-glucan branching enzyme
MGGEIAQFIEWRYYESLEWFLLRYDSHAKHRNYIKALNNFYLSEKTLWSCDHDWKGFEWIDADNNSQCILSFARYSASHRSADVVVLNCDVQTFHDYRIGVPKPGVYREIFNSDAVEFGGSGQINGAAIQAEPVPWHGRPWSIRVTVPPVGGAVFKRATK